MCNPSPKLFDAANRSKSFPRRSKRDRQTGKNGRGRTKVIKHKNEQNTHTAILSILPSLGGVFVAVLALMAKMGFRGRATIAGIDLGTTNSVICVQMPSKGVGEISCIPDPLTNSAIIPSVVSFSSRKPIAGYAAKQLIDTHPRSTIYNAKRIIGRPYNDPAVEVLRKEAQFQIVENKTENAISGALFQIDEPLLPVFSPEKIGSLVLSHLISITSKYLGHSSVKSAVIAIPAEFSPAQRHATILAYKLAGIKVLRILEEPTAAALAYGLDEKPGVEHVLVYDFGGGTLDVSILRLGKDSYVEVMGSAGDSNLGGADFDVAISRHLVATTDTNSADTMLNTLSIQEDQLPCENMPLCRVASFHTMAENMKINLSTGLDTVNSTCYTVHKAFFQKPTIQNICQHLKPITIILTRKKFDELVKKLYKKSVLPIRQVLKDLDMLKEDIDEVVMVGGTTRMPQIRELVKEELGKDYLNVDIDPDLTVAYGAASVID